MIARNRTALLVVITLLLSGVPIAHGLKTQTAVPSEAPAPVAFPQAVQNDEGTVVVHTPQIDTWKDYESIEARVAVEVTPAGESQPVYGVAEFVADTDPNLELRAVAVQNVEITVTSFPESNDQRRELLDRIVRSNVQSKTHYVPLDVLLTYIAPDQNVPDAAGLSFDPPPIFYSSMPAVLLITDGEPILAPIPDTKLQYVVNTNWDLFRHRDKEWYLRHDARWLKNKELSGAWKFDNSLPKDFGKLPEDGNWGAVKAAIPPQKAKEKPPTVFVSNRPAELIATKGAPQHHTVGGPGLEFVFNTESDVFRYESQYYYLVSGRWFRADQLRGPWEHVKELPEIFASIPSDHAKGHVLAAVPNTNEARLAALEASLPRKATVSRDAGENVQVFYQGEPQFEPVTGTEVFRAINSANDILKVGDEYYLCDNAVWYVAVTPEGPWTVADSIPAQIYTIPTSSPSYHVTHVIIEDSDDDSVSTAYTSGYFGVYVGFGVAMYGSGYYYSPYYGYYPYGPYPYYPYYYPYPYSYGASSWYNPNTGRYGRSNSVYGPYGGYGRAASYNPETGAYARGEAVWDSNEIAGRGVAYNPRTGTGIATNRYANESGGWGESLITHNDRWLETQSEWTQNSRTTELRGSEGGTGTVTRERQGDTVTGTGEFQRGDETLETRSARNEQGAVLGYQTGSGETGVVGRSAEGDLYAGKDGQVYRRSEDGWQQNTGEGWNPVEVPADRAAQFDQAREKSAAQDRGTRQSTPGTQGFSGSYNGSRTTRSYDSSQYRGTWDSSRRSDLNRSYDARMNGYQRYNNRAHSGAAPRASGAPAFRRRR